MFACTADTHDLFTFQRSKWIFLLSKISVFPFASVLKSSEEFVFSSVLAHTPLLHVFQVSPVVLCQWQKHAQKTK